MRYNQWYSHTYELILETPNWSVISRDVSLKLALIFSWMPHVIMRSHQNVGKDQVTRILQDAQVHLASLPTTALWKLKNLDRYTRQISVLFDALRQFLGPVATSKFLHFCKPRLLPMFDSSMATITNGEQYVSFVRKTHAELQKPRNQKKAADHYKGNLLRGWDIYQMERRIKT